MPSATSAPTVPTRRQRLRARTLDEIAGHALALVDQDGAQAVTLAAIGKAMGMSVPGLYRYFKSRDELLQRLLGICHEQLASALEQCAGATAQYPPETRLRALASAYRVWALEHPKRYEMLFEGTALGAVDYRSVVGGDEAAAAGRGMGVVVALMAEMHGATTSFASSQLDQQLKEAWRGTTGHTAAPAALRLAVITWTRLHGIVSLEVSGALTAMGIDAALLVDGEIEDLLGPPRAGLKIEDQTITEARGHASG